MGKHVISIIASTVCLALGGIIFLTSDPPLWASGLFIVIISENIMLPIIIKDK